MPYPLCRRSTPSAFFLSIALLLGVVPVASAAPIFFTGIGDIPGRPGQRVRFPTSVSGDGSTVVGSVSRLGVEGFYWTQTGGTVGLGRPGEVESEATGVSTDGSVITGRTTITGPENGGFRWTSDGGFIVIPGFPGFESRANPTAISDDGNTIVGNAYNSPREAFRWNDDDGLIGLGFLPGGDFSLATGVSQDGSVIAGYGTSANSGTGSHEAFIWTSTGGIIGLSALPGGDFFESTVQGISSDGSTVVGQSRSALGREAFIWTSAGGMVGLGDLSDGNFKSIAYGVSADGSTVVGQGQGDSAHLSAMIWDQSNGMRDLTEVLTGLGLDITGWDLGAAYDISDDGLVIVGLGTNPDGDFQGWVASVPEPSTALLLSLGLVGIAAKRKRSN